MRQDSSWWFSSFSFSFFLTFKRCSQECSPPDLTSSVSLQQFCFCIIVFSFLGPSFTTLPSTTLQTCSSLGLSFSTSTQLFFPFFEKEILFFCPSNGKSSVVWLICIPDSLIAITFLVPSSFVALLVLTKWFDNLSTMGSVSTCLPCLARRNRSLLLFNFLTNRRSALLFPFSSCSEWTFDWDSTSGWYLPSWNPSSASFWFFLAYFKWNDFELFSVFQGKLSFSTVLSAISISGISDRLENSEVFEVQSSSE